MRRDAYRIFGLDGFRRYFRMSATSFMKLADRLRASLECSVFRYRTGEEVVQRGYRCAGAVMTVRMSDAMSMVREEGQACIACASSVRPQAQMHACGVFFETGQTNTIGQHSVCLHHGSSPSTLIHGFHRGFLRLEDAALSKVDGPASTTTTTTTTTTIRAREHMQQHAMVPPFCLGHS